MAAFALMAGAILCFCLVDATAKWMTGGYDGLFINYERVDEYGQARRLSIHETAPLEKYLARYKIPWEYRGHYTSILIKEEVKTA